MLVQIIRPCVQSKWNVLAGGESAQNVQVKMRLRFNPDGTLGRRRRRSSTRRARRSSWPYPTARCAPCRPASPISLPPAKYEALEEISDVDPQRHVDPGATCSSRERVLSRRDSGSRPLTADPHDQSRQLRLPPGPDRALRPVLRGIAGFLLAALLRLPGQRRQPGAAAPAPAWASACRTEAAAAAAAAQSGPLEVDITQGTLKPIPIAMPEFLGEDPQLRARGLRRGGGRSRALGPVRAARSGLLHRPRARPQRAAALPGLARDQRPGAGGRAGPDGRRTAGWSASSASGTCSRAASWPRQRFAVGADDWRRLGHLIADQVYRAPHRREGLLRHPGRLHRRDRPQGPAATSASPSWTRTAPTCGC